MEYTIHKYNKAALELYIQSDEYKESEIWPISHHRANSHLNNPRLQDDDVILTLAKGEGKILGYRTVMADYIYNGEDKIKVGWISGTWVDPEYRRHGLATDLFNEIFNDWKGKLMYTNYAPVSKKVYDKTGAFETYKSVMGCRFHMKSNMAEILPSRFPVIRLLRKILPAFDKIFNHYVLPFITDPGMRSRLSYNIMIKTKLNEDESVLLFKNTLTQRTQIELNWILQFPWVVEISELADDSLQKYFFSAAADVFKQYFTLVYKGGVLVSIVMISIKNTQMKVPYFYSQDLDLGLIADLLFSEAWKNGISHIDVYDEDLVTQMKLKTQYFAFSKNRERNYLVSTKILNELPDRTSVKIPDGEGDVVFV